jgi:AcrR family transcriptional regulator
MNLTERRLDATRRATLDALAHVIVESKGFGFSVQDVANRAGVSHRTVYNHFPSREELSEALAGYVEELLSTLGPAPDAELPSLQTFADAIGPLYRGLATREVHVRAYVMLMMANRQPAQLTRKRSRRFESAIARDAALPAGLTAVEAAAVIRMFVSSTGWHTLTEHLGLSVDQAATAATWATRTLVSALEVHDSRRPLQKAKARPNAKAKAKDQAKAKKEKHGRRTRKDD